MTEFFAELFCKNQNVLFVQKSADGARFRMGTVNAVYVVLNVYKLFIVVLGENFVKQTVNLVKLVDAKLLVNLFSVPLLVVVAL